MKNYIKLLFIISIFTTFVEFANSESNWQESMQNLSKTLTDVFPFLYSRSEFRDTKNKKALLESFDRLASIAHKLPDGAGKGFIGSEPLLKEIKSSVNDDFKKAKEFLSAGKHDLAQSAGQNAIKKCFGCHTTIQAGPNFPPTNQEVMGIATPFVRGKLVVFIAIRQFHGALDLIEKDFSKAKSAVPKIELAKLYMVVSLRTLQDTERAEKFIKKAITQSQGDKPALVIFEQWAKDIKLWSTPTPASQNAPATSDDLKFVAQLRETLNLHNKVGQSSANDKAQVFYKLGQLYESFKLEEFSELPIIYYKACMNEKPSAEIRGPCEQNLQKLVN